MATDLDLARRVGKLEKRPRPSAGQRLVDAGLIVALVSFALPWPDAIHVALPVSYLGVVVPAALRAAGSTVRGTRPFGALACIALLVGLLAYSVQLDVPDDYPEGRGPFFLMIGMLITLAGISWSRDTPAA